MRALTLDGVGGLERLSVADVPEPELQSPGDVRVRVCAAALNHLDLFVATGAPGMPAVTFPHIVGADGAGVVDSVGGAVRNVGPGDHVMLNPGISCGGCDACRRGDEPLCERFELLGEHRAGTIAEYVVVPAANVARVPDGMTWAEAAAFPLVTLTAWRMLSTRARLKAGETVLVWGAGGGVAQAAIQIATLAGATVIAASGAGSKLELARRLGAHHLIDRSATDVAAEVKRITGGRGVDVVVESVGQATWPVSLRCLARAGRLVTCGATTGPRVELDLRRVFWFQWSILGSTMGSHAEFAEIVALAGEGKLRPVVDRVVPLTESVSAFQRLARGEQAGKLVIEVSS